MSQLAIKGHATRGKEVVEILEMLGGKNRFNYDGTFKELIYTIGSELELDVFNINSPDVKKNDYTIFTVKEFLEKFPYKVGDKVKVPYEDGRITGNELYEYKILKIKWDSLESTIKYGLPTGNEQRIEYYSTDNLNMWNKKETMEDVIKIDIPKGYEFAEIDDDNQQVVFTKIQSEYPKTHLECCDVLGRAPINDDVEGYKWKLIMNFQRLLVCRDAYWKHAGEEMGLNKPWEPDWLNVEQDKYVLYTHNNSICSNCYMLGNNILAFPTEEMRDVFYENFKDLIEQCKELL